MNLLKKIQEGQVYIIAEMSANHAGKLENALRIIEEAAAAGADCVKIQTYTADSLTIDCRRPEYNIKGGLWDGYNYYDLYQEAMTPWEWQQELKDKCKEVGVDFLSTPFDFKGVDFLEELGVEAYKIASYELIDIPLIEYIASKGKPIIMSCGMGTPEEIQEALDACSRFNNEQVVLLKCCSQYPADYEDMNIATISLMQQRFNRPVGLSDHSEGTIAPVVAAVMGASVIEKHVKLDDGDESADSGFSMTMKEFAQMVQDVRNAVKIKGHPTFERTQHDIKSLEGRRSLVAVKPISRGEEFTKENIKSVRPAIGISPKYYSQLLGKKAAKDYEFGSPIDIMEIE